MRIVDAHAHIGKCRVFDLEVKPEELLSAMDRNEVDAAIVMPFPGAPDARVVHDQIAELSQRFPSRIFGMVNINPHCNPDDYFKEAERCVKKLGFVGIKLHTIGHAVNPLSNDARTVFETARELNVPVMVHTGIGAPFALPSHILPIAKEFSNIKIILAHSGFIFYTPEAYLVGKECQNIYYETSWLFPDDVKWLIKTFGPERVMMGSDLPNNLAPTLAIAKAANLSEIEKEFFMGKTAALVFELKWR